jgi:hypothetical protein
MRFGFWLLVHAASLRICTASINLHVWCRKRLAAAALAERNNWAEQRWGGRG